MRKGMPRKPAPSKYHTGDSLAPVISRITRMYLQGEISRRAIIGDRNQREFPECLDLISANKSKLNRVASLIKTLSNTLIVSPRIFTDLPNTFYNNLIIQASARFTYFLYLRGGLDNKGNKIPAWLMLCVAISCNSHCGAFSE
ncbi:hypothetical protein PUN28_011219 [Cardiocondyla obscurior]|uniref:Uncharacterized protein n=1 Tax=Cardiocondyla obscurior TaxID=286306 RepID=A0AAW2FJW8_9HYME